MIFEWLPCQQNYRKRSNIPRNVDETSTNVKTGSLIWSDRFFYSTAARRALISSRLASRYLSSRSSRSCSAVRYSESRSKSSWTNSLRVRMAKGLQAQGHPNSSRQQVAVAFRVPVIANIDPPLLVVKCNNALPSPVPEVGPVRLLATTLSLHLISHVQ